MFPDGLQVSHDLAGMAEVCETVDDGDGAVFCQCFHFFLFKSTDHDAVQIPGQNSCGVFCGFATADLCVFGADEQRMAAQLIHACFKGYTGSGGGFFKDHTQCFAFEDMVFNTLFFL